MLPALDALCPQLSAITAKPQMRHDSSSLLVLLADRFHLPFLHLGLEPRDFGAQQVDLSGVRDGVVVEVLSQYVERGDGFARSISHNVTDGGVSHALPPMSSLIRRRAHA